MSVSFDSCFTCSSFNSSSIFTGSSRQFAGFNTEVDESIIDRIWARAAEFFPKLRNLSLTDFIKDRKVRVGLRPYSKSISFDSFRVKIYFPYCSNI